MILAGIDEAGLGPRLGPLVTAGAAFRVADGWNHSDPWAHWSNAVTDKPRRDGRILVADSKLAGGNGDTKRLDFAVLACLLIAGSGLTRSDALSYLGCHGRIDELDRCPWHAGAEWTGHEEETRSRAVAASRGWISAMAATGAAFLGLRAAPCQPARMNGRYSNGMNKNQVLLSETGNRIQEIAGLAENEEINIMVDKQGGRNNYRAWLQGLFPDFWLETLAEGGESSRYRLRRPSGGDVTIEFAAKADRGSFATALASMTAKWLRERLMDELNSWFTARQPGLRTTAGYPEDATRWLEETKELRKVLAIDDFLLIRER